MARKHGITSTTYDNLVIDSGAAYLDYGIGVNTATFDTVITTDALTVTINGTPTTFTFVESGAGTNEVLLGESDTEAATNMAAAIDALSNVSAESSGAVVTVTADSADVSTSISTSDTTITIGTNGLTSTLFGATRGGNTFTIETECRDMEADGAKGSVKGGRRITGVTATLTVNLLEMSSEFLAYALPGSSTADDPDGSPTHDKITRALAIASTDYHTNVAIVGEVQGKTSPVIVGIDNALVDGNFELSFSEDDEGVVALQFKGHFDPSDMDAEPWFIKYPKA